MTRFDESRTATQRLSRLMQSAPPPASPEDRGWAWRASHGQGGLISRFFSRKVRFSIGAEVVGDRLCLACIRHVGDRRQEVVALRRVDLSAHPDGVTTPTQRLRGELRAMGGGQDRPEIWAVSPLETAEMQLVAVPQAGVKDGGELAYWAVQEARPFEESETVFDYQMIRPAGVPSDGASEESWETGTAPMVGILGFLAERREIDAVWERFADAGYPVTGLCPYPVAFQNLIQAGVLETGGQALCRLLIAETYSRIDVFSSSGALGLSRTIRSCVSSMVDVLRARIGGAIRAGIGEGGSEGFTPVDRDSARVAFQALLEDRTPESGPAAGIAPNELLGLVEKPLQRLVWQVERTIEAYGTKVRDDPVATLCISGEVSRSARIRSYLASQIDLPVTVQSAEEMTVPGTLWPDEIAPEGLARFTTFEPTIGIALSRLDQTPNFVFPFRDKVQRIKGRRIRRWTWALLIGCMMAILGGYAWQQAEVLQAESAIQELEAALGRRIDAQDGIRVDRPLIELQVDRLKEERAAIRDIAKRYRMTALISAATAFAPDSLNFSRLFVVLPPAFRGTEAADSSARRRGDVSREVPRMAVEGFLVGTREQSEGDLLRYIASLKETALFARISVQQKSRVDHQGEPALRFGLQLEIRKGAGP
mgnify:CR=1 FL=1